ncbi:histidine kinase dimerization/phosphoacceptor domain-containing protein [Streptomyces turgidiscabies]|uniref:Signal transduction histidine kinase n=1 Tax=Streptomyces turgidiscabies TaxID=85558 RepID=A0ABU0RV56_9ACTN|nr:histidine kinase dimerization/phosphoacceptor domain-containing protein [Streptomyces turgidiscabies]MDQ0935834.1 signal transduction histidine kinase [Streptomyces turgidiscabies]
MSSREGRGWAADGRGALLSPCVAAAWPGLLLLRLSADALYDPAVDRRARMAVGCAVAALGADLFGYRDISLWTGQFYASTVHLPVLAVLVGLWLGGRRRLRRAPAAAVEQPSVESQLRAVAARIGERSRIAAETHDVLAHGRSLIAPHTGVPATKGDSLPAPVAERIGLLRTTSVEVLADLRDVLGVVREPEAPRLDAPRPGAALAPVTVRAVHRPPATLTEVTSPLVLSAQAPSAAAADSSPRANASPRRAALRTPGRPVREPGG